MSALRNALEKSRSGTFGLQITSMIDMFTLILVFLLKSYSSSAIDLTPSQSLRLPASTSRGVPIEALKLVASEKGLFVDDKLVLALENGRIPSQATDKDDSKLIRPLFEALETQAKKSKSIASKNETVEFDGKVIFQGDKSLSFLTLKKIMYTAAVAGYTDVKLAVVSLE